MSKILTAMNERVDRIGSSIQSYLDRLQPRERVAILILSIFLLLVAIGSLLWFPHQAALKQQQRLTELKDTITWMQSNAVQLSTESTSNATVAEKVQRIAQQQGLSIESQDNQGQMKIATTHQNYAVLANFLTQLAQQGISIQRLDMQKQADGTIQLNAIIPTA